MSTSFAHLVLELIVEEPIDRRTRRAVARRLLELSRQLAVVRSRLHRAPFRRIVSVGGPMAGWKTLTDHARRTGMDEAGGRIHALGVSRRRAWLLRRYAISPT